MMKMRRAFSVMMTGAMAISLLAGCGGNDAETSGGESGAAAFKIGGTTPLTGLAAIYGNAVNNGAELAVEEINAEGGIQFELKMQDDEADPEKSLNCYNQLMDWGMQLSLEGTTTKCGEAIAVNHFEDRVFGLTPSASAPAVTEGKDNVYQMCFNDPGQGTAAADYIAASQIGTKIAVIYKNDDTYSTGVYEKFKTESEAKGLEIVSTGTFTETSQIDFNVQLSEAQKAGADLVFMPIYYQPAALILKQADAMGYEPEFFGVDGMDGLLTLEDFDLSLAEGVMLLTPFNADAEDERTQNFVTKYVEKYGDLPNQFAADAYDCVYAYKQAIENSGATPDMSAQELCDLMIHEFSTMTFQGLTGENMTWKDGKVSKEPKGMVIRNGVYEGM